MGVLNNKEKQEKRIKTEKKKEGSILAILEVKWRWMLQGLSWQHPNVQMGRIGCWRCWKQDVELERTWTICWTDPNRIRSSSKDLDPLDSDLGTRSIKGLTQSNKVWKCQEKFNEEPELREILTSVFIHKMCNLLQVLELQIYKKSARDGRQKCVAEFKVGSYILNLKFKGKLPLGGKAVSAMYLKGLVIP